MSKNNPTCCINNDRLTKDNIINEKKTMNKMLCILLKFIRMENLLHELILLGEIIKNSLFSEQNDIVNHGGKNT